MTQRFLITGLPRSRTAWFSTVAGALHEPIAQQGYAAFRPKWKEGQGVSDSHAAAHLPAILTDLAPRTLIVQRPIAEVLASLGALFTGRVYYNADRLLNYVLMLQSRIDQCATSPLVRRVAYECLDDIDTLYQCFDWLGVNPANLEQAMHMQIVSSIDWNLQQIRMRAA